MPGASEFKMKVMPWKDGTTPLMLAPMQGVTNRGMRGLFEQMVQPDTLFTEFVRVKTSTAPLSRSDRRALNCRETATPLVVQLIGHDLQALQSAAKTVEEGGAEHLNINMGCPYGRMSTVLTGGGMLKKPEALPEIVHGLRSVVKGTFSVKLRAGFDDPRQVFTLLPLFEEAGVDFLILHPRTVVQQYAGLADHSLTAEVVKSTRLPVIANGDINAAQDGLRVLESTGAAGLMLGRGAISDPHLFTRLRGQAPAAPTRQQRREELRAYLLELLQVYEAMFCGETQVLCKIKEVFAFIREPWLAEDVRALRRCKTLPALLGRVQSLL